MLIQISNPVIQTQIFIAIFMVALLLSAKKAKQKGMDKSVFPLQKTIELKGFAILAVLFGHIGYQLAPNTNFLFPISTLAGVGVDLFLLLSGFGLTVSMFKKHLTILEFYRKRLLSLLIPLWIILLTYIILDFFILQRTYPTSEVIKAFLGIFQRADTFININSPLWFITLISFYYLVFPIAFSMQVPLISATIILVLSYFVLNLQLPVNQDLLKIYKLHTLAFPAGIVLATIINLEKLKQIFKQLDEYKNNIIFRLITIVSLLIFVSFFAVNSGVGKGIQLEQEINFFISLAFFLIFYLKKTQLRLFTLFGLYSYEVYLIHWPILFRYDLLYKNLPAYLATGLYLVIFVVLGYLLQKLIYVIFKRLNL